MGGVPKSSEFNTETSRYVTRFEADLDVKLPTLLFLNRKFYYPEGYKIEVKAVKKEFIGKVKFSVKHVDENYVEVTVSGSEGLVAKKVEVVLTVRQKGKMMVISDWVRVF